MSTKCGRAYVPYYGNPSPGMDVQEHRHCEREIDHLKNNGCVCGPVGACCQKGREAEAALQASTSTLQCFYCPDHSWRYLK